jgi:hypothetical protein
MNRILMIAAAALLSLSCLGLAIAPAWAAETPSRWQTALDTLGQHGHERIEEIDLTLTGRFDVDALDHRRVEHDLRLSRDGSRIEKSRSDGSIEDLGDSLTLEQVRGALSWLQAEGYQDIRSVSGDDGWIEIEARGADRRRVEIKLQPGTHEVIELEFEERFDLD